MIIGQDPYPNPGQAHGLCFSTETLPLPASLRNIVTELKSEGFSSTRAESGVLSSWSKQGVFLLNRILTVPHKNVKGHANWGWETFTDKTIEVCKPEKRCNFFIVGSTAQSIEHLIDPERHHILCSAHPSPLSSYRGFFGNNHFRRANEFLVSKNLEPIQW